MMKRKMFIVGPLPPFRGGISHSNAVLCKNLSRHDVTCISFKRQFPDFLYPGKDQKDAGGKPASVRTLTMLDSINPLSWIRAYRAVKREKPSHLVFQWWSPFFTPSYWTIACLVKMFTKTKVSAICQNVTIHESGIMGAVGNVLTSFFFRKMDYLVTYSSSDKKDVREMCPKAKVEYIVESPTSSQLGATVPKELAKKKLGLKGRNILFFGFVRGYKGLSYLLKAMPEILKEKDVTLNIVGEFWEGKESYIREIEKLGIKGNVKIVDRYVSDKEVVLYFSAVDAVVLPYISSTESGIIQMAYGLGTPVIATDVGGNPDLIEDGKSGILLPPGSSEEVSRAVLRFYKGDMEKTIKKGMEKKKGIFSWDKEKESVLFGEFGQD